ncbi:MAG: chromosome partitioning protein ParB, partial [Chitinophagaceae bacterium]|nr:chromosome partitioning protein ParB [Chitinophagaceae bacterium]
MSTPNKKDALGKGIRSLLQNIDTDLKHTSGNLSSATGNKPEGLDQPAASMRIKLDQIEVNPKQPRRDF